MRTFVRLLGRASIRVGDAVWEPAADRRGALLYYLAASAAWVPRDDLLYLFWPDSEEEKGRANLRQLLVTVRGLPFVEGLEVERTRVRWPVATDLQGWAAALARGDLSAAATGWPGPFLDGFRLPTAPEYESWLELERAAWHERGRSVLLEVAGREARAGRAEAAADLLDGWLAQAPLDEEALRAWLEACARAGRHTTAVARFAAFEVRLARELGLAPERSTVAIVEALRAEAVAAHPQRQATPPTRQGRSPGRHAATFVGRDAELALLEEALLGAASPLVTLMAAGGMGKTRLALAVADRLRARFDDGAAVAWLAGASTLEQVGPTLLEALGLEPEPMRPPLEQVVDALSGRRLLLVVDNVEQLPGFGEIAARLREAAPGVVWLVTSRERLGLGAEVLVELDGLPYPKDGDADDLARYGAVALLLERARRVGHAIDLAAEADAVARVCRLTAGMPLALELAAGWLRVMPLPAIADELQRGLDLLAATDGDVDPRHVDMRVVFDASWRALSRPERTALVRLAAFQGGFTEVAAREVADVGRPLLLALRNKSFLSLDAGRFFQHPLLAAYVRERASADEAAWAEARERHAAWFCAYLATWEDAGQANRHLEADRALVAEHANIEAAWAFALDAGWWDALKKGGAHLGISYLSAGRPLRWWELLRDALARVPRETSAWAVLEVHATSIDQFAGRVQEAYERRRAAVEVLRRCDDPFSLAWGLFLFGESAHAWGRADEARAAVEEAGALFTALGERNLLGMMLYFLQAYADDPDEHERWRRAGEANLRATANGDHETEILRTYGPFVADTYGDYPRALALMDRAVAMERVQAISAHVLVETLRDAARIRLAAGDLETAAAHAAEALALWPPLRALFPHGEAEAQALLARVAWLRGDAATAEALVAPGSDAASTLEGVMLRSEMALARGDLATARGCADLALAMAAPPRIGRAGQVQRVRALLASAHVALAQAEPAVARCDLAEALALATSRRFLPALLQVCALAAPLLPADVARAVLASVAGHPATPFEARRRLAGVGPALVDPDWGVAQALAARVATAVAPTVAPTRRLRSRRGRRRRVGWRSCTIPTPATRSIRPPPSRSATPSWSRACSLWSRASATRSPTSPTWPPS
jgi:predicted ATPase/DNA-binding SARP family transcriptional activator